MLLQTQFFFQIETKMIVAGLDEAGAGSIAFDLVAAAVILPYGGDHTLFKDSKKLTPKQRENLYYKIKEVAITIGVGKISPCEIDQHGMAWARRQVFIRALRNISIKPDKLIVDGTIFEAPEDLSHIQTDVIPKADNTFPVVSAASIVAKHLHDVDVINFCEDNAEMSARYEWAKNKGYGTKKHLEAIKEFGRIPNIHRYSFRIKAHGEA